MNVIKRDGRLESVSYDKIQKRIEWLIKEPTPLNAVNGAQLTQKVINGIIPNIKTSEIDDYTANLSASLSTTHLE